MAPRERRGDRRQARGQAALEHRHREADGALLLLHRLVGLVLDVLGDLVVELALGAAEVELDRLDRALGEELLSRRSVRIASFRRRR